MEPPIAATYSELQSLPALFAVVRSDPQPARGSAWQAIRALFQSMEVALTNLEELARRTTFGLRERGTTGAISPLEWMVGFGKTWNDLAWLVRDMAPVMVSEGHRLTLVDSPSMSLLESAESELARQILTADEMPLEGQRLMLRYVMLQRASLEYAQVAGAPYDYAQFVQPEGIRAAVLERQLPGETAFMQFRAAHQMPELLVDVVNDHIELAIELIGSRAAGVRTLLRRADRLMDAIARMTDLLVDQLSTGQYHQIREALGLTSGSHSTGLHFHLMRDLYPTLARAAEGESEEVKVLVRALGLHIDRWRLGHVNLPRTNLGGAGTGTKSLTGSPDALQTVASMREAGRARDPFVAADRSFRATEWESELISLATVEKTFLAGIAQRTQEQFPDIQDRKGRYSAPAGFTPPKKRQAAP